MKVWLHNLRTWPLQCALQRHLSLPHHPTSCSTSCCCALHKLLLCRPHENCTLLLLPTLLLPCLQRHLLQVLYHVVGQGNKLQHSSRTIPTNSCICCRANCSCSLWQLRRRP
jgi:hypothetical protein